MDFYLNLKQMHVKFLTILYDLFPPCRLEVLNEQRSGVVQMVKLAEKERENLEVL